MRLSYIAFLVLLLVLPVHADDADNWLQNGDFSSGSDHWRGDGRSPAEYATDNDLNPLDKPDPLVSKGLIITLRGGWDKVQQDFRGQGTSGILTVTYMVSPDLAFSTNPDDYKNVPIELGFQFWNGLVIPPGDFVVFIADFGSNNGRDYPIKPKPGSTAPQTIRLPFGRLTPLSDKTITFGFPPGTGKVVLLSVDFSNGRPDGGTTP